VPHISRRRAGPKLRTRPQVQHRRILHYFQHSVGDERVERVQLLAHQAFLVKVRADDGPRVHLRDGAAVSIDQRIRCRRREEVAVVHRLPGVGADGIVHVDVHVHRRPGRTKLATLAAAACRSQPSAPSRAGRLPSLGACVL